MISDSTLQDNRKRPRTTTEYVEDPDIWSDDGNVVIAVVEQTKEGDVTHAFKCHKFTLCKYSSVFQDMFSMPSPAEAEEYDGVPVVVLPDPYQDVRGLLRMLDDPIRYARNVIYFHHID